MTTHERLERHLTRGLDDLARSAGPPDIDDILALTAQTRQRRARFPFQRSTFPTGTPGVLARVATGRFLPMTPTIRYAAVATFAMALGLAVAPILGGPGPSQIVASPAPSLTPVADPAWVTGTITPSNGCIHPTTTIEYGVRIHHRGYTCEPQIWTTSDLRLSGTASVRWNADTYQTDDGAATINVGVTVVTTVDGGWHCTSTPLLTHGPDLVGHQVNPDRSTCTGSGAQEGLVAIVSVDMAATPATIEAVIVDADLPPTP